MKRLAASLVLVLACSTDRSTKGSPQPAAPSIHGLSAKTIDGSERQLAEYAGKVALVVNVASKCGFTPQYEGLEELQRRYAPRGLRVLGFPANDFGGQEPGADPEIRSFCSTTYGVTFDLFAKISVVGPDMHPLYAKLTDASTPHGGPVQWNFTKFLVDAQGRVVDRFEPSTSPLSSEVVAAIERELAR